MQPVVFRQLVLAVVGELRFAGFAIDIVDLWLGRESGGSGGRGRRFEFGLVHQVMVQYRYDRLAGFRLWKFGEDVVHFCREFHDFRFERDNQFLVALEPPHEKLQVLWQPRIEAHKIRPVPAGAGHLGEHLRSILDREDAGEHVVQVRRSVWAFHLDHAILTHQAIRRGSKAWKGGMEHEAASLDQDVLLHFVGGAAEGLLVGAPLHFLADVLRVGLAGEDLDDELRPVLRTRGRYAFFDFCEHVRTA